MDIIGKNLILISENEASYVSKRNLFDKLVGENVIVVEFDNRKTTKKFIKKFNSRFFHADFTAERKVTAILESYTIFSIYKRYGDSERDIHKYQVEYNPGNKKSR